MKRDTSIKNLTSKQEKFALLVFNGNGLTEAYRAVYACANMKPETVNEAACLLAKNSKVAARLADLRAKSESKAVASRRECLEIATTIARAKILKPQDRLKAIEVLAKMCGFNEPEKAEGAFLHVHVRRTVDEMRDIVMREIEMKGNI